MIDRSNLTYFIVYVELELEHEHAFLCIPAAAAAASCMVIIYGWMCAVDRRDEQQLERLRAERKVKIGSFRGSHHNLQKLIQVNFNSLLR